MSGVNMVPLWLVWVVVVQSTALFYVERYEVVRPRRVQGGQRNLQDDQQPYPDTVQYELTIEGRNHTINLDKNKNVIARGYTETHYTEDGERVTTSPNVELCYYHGHIVGMKDSAVSVGICSDMSGFVRVGQQFYLIEPLGQSVDGDHAVYRREHLKFKPSYGFRSNSSTLYDQDQQRPRLSGLFTARSLETKSITHAESFVELFVVVDNTEYKRYGNETKSRVLKAIIHVDKLYRLLNIRIILVGLEIWMDKDHIDVDVDPGVTLYNFMRWRRNVLLKRVKHDNVQLVTGKDFIGDRVGTSYAFDMCTENSGGVNQDHHDDLIGLASTIAHEMGHNLGLSDDTKGCRCGPNHSSKNCVMIKKLRKGNEFPKFFSSCSAAQLCDFMERAQPGCLSKPASVRTIDPGPSCGNALLEPGEECDCGTVEECMNSCCNAATCRLTEGSQCAHGQCCDNCQIRQAGSVCRPSAGDCDLPEYCSGLSDDCPEDDFQMNGTPCSDQAEGYCYNGQCPTLQQHCWRLFGPGAEVGSDVCFDLNTRGIQGANCGWNKNGLARCTTADLKCGSIFCSGGGESITGERANYIVSSTVCKAAVDQFSNRKLDMVPQGTRCGPEKVCLDNRCVDMSVYGKKEDCAKKCNNKGVCNHKSECACDPGWAPPYCEIQYGLPKDLTSSIVRDRSENSCQRRNAIIAGVCATLVVLLLITTVTAGLMRYKRNNMGRYACRSKEQFALDRLSPMFQELSEPSVHFHGDHSNTSLPLPYSDCESLQSYPTASTETLSAPVSPPISQTEPYTAATSSPPPVLRSTSLASLNDQREWELCWDHM